MGAGRDVWVKIRVARGGYVLKRGRGQLIGEPVKKA